MTLEKKFTYTRVWKISETSLIISECWLILCSFLFFLRIYCEDKQAFLQDCEDDGETAAGGRLLHLMQVKKLVFEFSKSWADFRNHYNVTELVEDYFNYCSAYSHIGDCFLKGERKNTDCCMQVINWDFQVLDCRSK